MSFYFFKIVIIIISIVLIRNFICNINPRLIKINLDYCNLNKKIRIYNKNLFIYITSLILDIILFKLTHIS